MRKKIWTLLTVLAMLCVCLIPDVKASDAVLSVKTPATIPRAGDTFEVTVDISGNPGITSIGFELTFDHEELDCTDIEAGGAISGALFASNPDTKNGAKIGSAASEASNVNGTVATFTFRAKEDISAFRFGVDSLAVYDAESNNLSSGITVENVGSVSTPEPDATDGGTAQPTAGGETSKSTAGSGTAQPAASEGTTQSAADSGTAQPTAGGETSKSAAGGEAAQHATDGGTSQSTAGGEAARPTTGGGTSQSAAGSGTAQPATGGGTTQSAAGDGTARPTTSGGTSRSTTSGGTAQPPAAQTPTVTVETVRQFTDTAGHWGADWIARAADRGLIKGYEDGSFRPDAKMSRADYVLVLWRAAGTPEPSGTASFPDVPADAYYQKAVAWASEKGIANGKGTGFDPAGSLTRQEAMTILFRYAGERSGAETMFAGEYDKAFSDSGEIAAWAKPAMYWAYYHEIISGMGDGKLGPQGAATRAQLAKILVGYLEKQ